MVRTRLATLTLAGGLLLTSSGCLGGMRDGFRNWRNGATVDCTCYDVNGGHDAAPIAAQGPVLVAPEATFTGPPPTQTPMGPPPRIIPIPATPMPWSGTALRKS